MKIRDKFLEFPLIQGGMGVGVSLGGLAGAVMKEGCMGVISAAHPGYRKPDFLKNSRQCNEEALVEESDKARAISGGKGLLGVNIMCASKDYAYYVKAAVRAKVDAIISGAGLPLDLPAHTDGSVLLAPIVSSAKAAQLICRIWDKRYNCLPDFIVVEASDAGGHLGFKLEDLVNNTCESLESIVRSVKNIIVEFENKYQYKIPVFAGGGVFDGYDMAKCLEYGADGVQIGTRFIATDECDADIKFKEMIVNAKKEDIDLIKSPTGFPGRAVISDFIKETIKQGNISVKKCINCLTPCHPNDTPYCISKALIEAVKGNEKDGLFFCGTNAYRVNEIVSVKTLIDSIKKEYKEVSK